jgi:malonyl-CoA O-methyltransferase
MKGLFVTGTGTDVGKTVVAACLVKALDADYWKPIQSGLKLGDEASDSKTVTALAGLTPSRLHPCTYSLQAALSPHEAARLEGVTISMDAITLPVTKAPLVVEGAGGLLVPLNEFDLMIDLIARLALPVVVVADSGLGTINHTLLSLQALRARDLAVLGVIVNGPLNQANCQAIEKYGKINIIMQLDQLEPLDAKAIERAAKHMPNNFLET